ncbi:hypothetical protein ACB092_08G189900 [Castanea dentata]
MRPEKGITFNWVRQYYGEDSNDHHPIYMDDDDKLALQMPIVTEDLARCVPLNVAPNCGIPLDVPPHCGMRI